MKARYIKQVVTILLILLFTYTATSKFLDYEKFVFQMRLAPVPFMKMSAPILGYIVPAVEILIAIALGVGFFHSTVSIKALYASVILLSIFEVYITIMLLSDSHLPCTCGGIVSQMGWKQHLFFNAFFIIGGIFTIRFLQKNHASRPIRTALDDHKILSRA
ncbi:MauE/DoxX family redox-associated membrane protein [Mucilaginibacter sp. FT3.2]|uniref:MauE/DoxX family redox-associated membrane protein n=1 Tax=Mucilaginibacter sp. FT3.2 TaxID=2723090 RepID=UPI00160B1D46|nr:MauE/DoxX family redox-associated membrane protein [Mucilaginibacter sp. FT3.2]MBB6232486.1 hypothetical protein [Mucilaginibacter sp. FT3.2]